MCKIHASFHIPQTDCIVLIRYLRFFLDQCEDPGRTGKGILQLRHNARDLVKRLRVLVRIA